MIRMIYLTALKTIFQTIITKLLKALILTTITIYKDIKNRINNTDITMEKTKETIIFRDLIETIIVMQLTLNMGTKGTKRKNIVTKFTSTKEIQIILVKMTMHL